jgi:hypothetical protein
MFIPDPQHCLIEIPVFTFSVADPDPVWSEHFLLDPDAWAQIRILSIMNSPISNILVCVNAINTGYQVRGIYYRNVCFWFIQISVAVPDPVGSGPFWSDPDVGDRLQFRILALINDSVSSFFGVCKKALILKESMLFNFFSLKYFLEHIFIKKNFRKKLAKNLLGSGSGSGTRSNHFWKWDLDPVKNRPDPQPWYKYGTFAKLVR